MLRWRSFAYWVVVSVLSLKAYQVESEPVAFARGVRAYYEGGRYFLGVSPCFNVGVSCKK